MNSKALWIAKIKAHTVAEEMSNKTKSCTGALSQDLLIRFRPLERQKTRKKNKMEKKMSVINLAKSCLAGIEPASDSIVFSRCSVGEPILIDLTVHLKFILSRSDTGVPGHLNYQTIPMSTVRHVATLS